MAEVHVVGDQLVVTIKGIRKLGAMKSELRIPLGDVRAATVDRELSTGWPGLRELSSWPGVKKLGTDAYGKYLGGTFVQDGDRVFWDVADPAKAIVISLSGNEFERLIIEVDQPDQAVQLIEQAIADRAEK
ncbi:hypothetical protein [Nocardia cyriacigeorgica]|uniref:hypothetical protein n=1 Tax=Nocardia cyriacigeorgica TaxID=135487 RepID=UPI0024589284|nr:hypothetical protein [Nocardia cyriacigeorgica]